MDFQQTALAICGTTIVYALYQRYRGLTISDVPGPKNPSWIYGILGPFTRQISLSHQFCNRTPMVPATRRGYQDRTTASGRIWNRRSFERAAWGTHLYLVKVGCGWILTLMLSCRKTACGSWIQRPSTTFSRVPITDTGGRAILGIWSRRSWIGVSCGPRVSRLSCASQYNP